MDGELRGPGSAPHHGQAEAAVVLAAAGHRPEEIFLASVAAPAMTRAMVERLTAMWPVPLRQARTAASGSGVRNGYREPAQLGVDRWLAMVAAYGRFRTALCVVSAGTALTIDLVGADGQHAGGLILPGRALMRSALLQDTGGISAASGLGEFDPPPDGLLGRDTESCMRCASLRASACLVESCMKTSPGAATSRSLVVTGGDAPALIGALSMAAEHRPLLVLEGLALAHGAAPGSGAVAGSWSRNVAEKPLRNLFLALLMGNLLFLGWRLWIAPPEVPAEQLLSRGPEPDIAALSSPATAGAVTQAQTRAAPDKAADRAATRCLRIGPLADGQIADTLRGSLNARGISTTASSEEGQIWVGHWVQLETVSTRAEADAMATRLAAGGLADAYILQTSPPYSISLGVFRDKDRADKVAADAARLGFRPRITDRYRTGLQYLLTAVIPPGTSLSVDDLGRESGQILRAEPVPCPADAIGGRGALN